MKQCNINLLDLPNEILVIILQKLNNIDVLYSLFNINNQRLDNIIQENIFIHTLNFVLTALTDDTSSISDLQLNRFCTSILPRIHYHIKSLTVNSSSMERILFVANYPNLNQLKIFNFNGKIVSSYFAVESPFRLIFQQQITDLILVFDNYFDEISCEHYTTVVYDYILKFFENLKHLSIIGLVPKSFPPLLLRNLPLTTFYSSTLYKLSIHVTYFDDLLTLLDDRLQQLNTLNVIIIKQEYNSIDIYNMNNLPNLKCFDLQYDCLTNTYETQVLPLLRRMSNIEVLNLHLTMEKQTTFIDGKHLYNEIIMYMSQLDRFNFYFCTFIQLDYLIGHLSKDDIFQTFSKNIHDQVDCMIQYRSYDVKYHIYSLPFMFDYLSFIDNTFPNMIFNHVIRLVVNDFIPFEHEFFMRIAWSFPLLRILHVISLIPQTSISNKLDSDDQQLFSTIIEYPYLNTLDLGFVHHNYIDQFLNDKKTYLPSLTKLTVDYFKLKMVTRNFRNERTRLNCMKVKQLKLCHRISIHSEDFYAHFPSL